MIDTTNAPASGHYKVLAIEPIKLITALKLDFATGSFVKYLARYQYKGSPKTDLEKARFYLSLIERNEYACSPTSMQMVDFFCTANQMDNIETECLLNALNGFRGIAEKGLDKLIARYNEPA